jgi:hypothetical protein
MKIKKLKMRKIKKANARLTIEHRGFPSFKRICGANLISIMSVFAILLVGKSVKAYLALSKPVKFGVISTSVIKYSPNFNIKIYIFLLE